MIRFFKQLFGYSKRADIVTKSLEEHQYAAETNIRNIRNSIEISESLVAQLAQDINK